MSKLQSEIESLSTQFAQAVARAVFKSLTEIDIFGAASAAVAAPAAPKAKAAPAAPAAPKAKAAPAAPAPKAKAAPAPKAKPAKAAPVAAAPRANAQSGELLDALVKVLKKNGGGLYSEDLRRELGVERPQLAKAIAQGLATKVLAKQGDRRKTTYSLA